MGLRNKDSGICYSQKSAWVWIAEITSGNDDQFCRLYWSYIPIQRGLFLVIDMTNVVTLLWYFVARKCLKLPLLHNWNLKFPVLRLLYSLLSFVTLQQSYPEPCIISRNLNVFKIYVMKHYALIFTIHYNLIIIIYNSFCPKMPFLLCSMSIWCRKNTFFIL